VPEGFINRLEVNMLAFGGMLQARKSSAPRPVPTCRGRAWTTHPTRRDIGENKTVGEADPKFKAFVLKAYKPRAR